MGQKGIFGSFKRFRKLFLGGYIALSLLLCAVPVQAQQSLLASTRHVRPAVTDGSAVLQGSLPLAQTMNLSIVLPLRNTAALNHLLSQLYNPSSANYHHFLSVEEFAAQFGPTAEDYQTVVNFAKANGFTVSDTPANRLIVPLSGTVAQINISGVATFEVFRAADMPVVPICFGNGSPLRPEWSIGWRNGDVILFGERTLPPV